MGTGGWGIGEAVPAKQFKIPPLPLLPKVLKHTLGEGQEVKINLPSPIRHALLLFLVFDHILDELLEKVVSIMGAGTGFGVVLDGEER